MKKIIRKPIMVMNLIFFTILVILTGCNSNSREMKTISFVNALDIKTSVTDIKWLPSNEGFLVSQQENNKDAPGIYRYDLKSDQLSRLIEDHWYGFAIDPQNNFLLGFSLPFDQLEIRDLSTGKLIEEKSVSSCSGGGFLILDQSRRQEWHI